MITVIRQILIVAVLVFCILGGLAILGWPTQRIADAGAWLQVRLLNLKSTTNIGGSSGGSGTDGGKVDGPLRLMLPPALYSVEGEPMSIEYDNIVLSHDSEAYKFAITSDAASGYTRRRHCWTGLTDQPGRAPLHVSVTDAAGNVLDQGKTELRVAARNAGAGKKARLLILGASVTRQNWWANHLARKLTPEGNPEWSMIGRSYEEGFVPPFGENTLPGVRHEAEWGWSYTLFATFHSPEQAKTYHREKSPFVFLNDSGKPELDVARYYKEEGEGIPADFVVSGLGINDTWGLDPEDPVAMNNKFKEISESIEKLVAAFRKANPKTHFGIILPPPFTKSDRTFGSSYPNGTVTRWSARQVQHALVEKLIERYSGKEDGRIWLIPVYSAVDPVSGYPVDNAGHPYEYAQTQIARTVYSWLKWVLEQESKGGAR